MNSLEKSILATIVYYDVLDRPLTGWEIFKYRINYWRGDNKTRLLCGACAERMRSARNDGGRTRNDKKDLESIFSALENSHELKKWISEKNGLYFLRDRERIIKERIERQKIADQKWKKARRVIRFLQLIPFIRLVMISGSLAMNNTKDKSDIDLLIISKFGRIWTCRGLTTLFIHLIGQRRHGDLTKNRFCLNHYLTDKSLKIPFQSLYNSQTYAHLAPMWEENPPWLYKQFQKANSWIRNYLFFYPFAKKGYLKRVKPSHLLGFFRKAIELILDNRVGNKLELLLKRFQEGRIKKDPLTNQKGGRVFFNNEQLEFHPVSPEKLILERYNKKMRQLGLSELGKEKDSGLII